MSAGARKQKHHRTESREILEYNGALGRPLVLFDSVWASSWFRFFMTQIPGRRCY